MISDIAHRLEATSDTPRLDAQVLLAQILGKPKAWLLAHPEATLTKEENQALEASIHRLEQGEPLPYVLGHWEFYGLDFRVTPEVLIPRPETELLVERAIKWLESRPKRRFACDVGTGSGCIAIALAINAPELHILADDLSFAALKIAQWNVQKHNISDRVHLVQSDLLPPDARPYDLVTANLPYIPTPTLQTLPVYLREPALALDGGADGLLVIRRLIAQLSYALAPGGLALLEIEERQGQAALEISQQYLPERPAKLHKDLAGHDRLLEIGG